VGHLDQIKWIKISEQNFLDIASEAGTHSKEFENGVVVTITIDKGKIVKHEAKDKTGKSLKTSYLQMSTVAPASVAPEIGGDGPNCYICYQDSGGDYGGPGQVCGPIKCRNV
jgi:hypothetical protein